MATFVDDGEVPGCSYFVRRGPDAFFDAVGALSFDGSTPVDEHSLYRIASLTKPLTGALTMALVEDGIVDLEQSIVELLPELQEQEVLTEVSAPLDSTRPRLRDARVVELLTGTAGFGCIMSGSGDYPIQQREAELGLKTLGPPRPRPPFDDDAWIAAFSSLPLMEQPGAQFRYNTGMELLGILLSRAAGQALPQLFEERLFSPLAMSSTTFVVAPSDMDRFTTAYTTNGPDGVLSVIDDPETSEWSTPQPHPNAAASIVSTVADYSRFVGMLEAGGADLLSQASVAAMLSDHLEATQMAETEIFFGETGSWGYGLRVPRAGSGIEPVGGGYGWEGGTGTMWRSDPRRDLCMILFTQREMTSPAPPPIVRAFQAEVAAMCEGAGR